MPYCPKCKKKVAIGFAMSVWGVIHHNDDIDKWPDVGGGDYVSPDTEVNCAECNHKDILKEFKIP